MGFPLAVLVVNATSEISAILSELPGSAEWEIRNVPTNEAALAAVRSKHFDVVLTSAETSGEQDVDLLRKIRLVHPHTRVIILAGAGTPADAVAAMRENAVSYFTGPFEHEQLKAMLRDALETPPWDDGIVLRSATGAWINLLVRCDYATADRLVHFIDEISEDLPLEDRAELSTAFREMLINAMEHGGRFNPDEYVEISYLRSKRAVSCRIRDPGEGFSREEIPHAAVSNPPESPCAHMEHRESQGLRPGGFGILLASKLVDELIYNEKGNEVILIKHLDKARKHDAGDQNCT